MDDGRAYRVRAEEEEEGAASRANVRASVDRLDKAVVELREYLEKLEVSLEPGLRPQPPKQVDAARPADGRGPQAPLVERVDEVWDRVSRLQRLVAELVERVAL